MGLSWKLVFNSHGESSYSGFVFSPDKGTSLLIVKRGEKVIKEPVREATSTELSEEFDFLFEKDFPSGAVTSEPLEKGSDPCRGVLRMIRGRGNKEMFVSLFVEGENVQVVVDSTNSEIEDVAGLWVPPSKRGLKSLDSQRELSLAFEEGD